MAKLKNTAGMLKRLDSIFKMTVEMIEYLSMCDSKDTSSKAVTKNKPGRKPKKAVHSRRKSVD